MDGEQRCRSTPITAVNDDVVDAPAADAAARSTSRHQSSSSPTTHHHHHQQQQQQSAVAPASGDVELQLEGSLFVVCDALVDVYADVPLEFLTAHHLQHGRAIVASQQHQGLFSHIVGYSSSGGDSTTVQQFATVDSPAPSPIILHFVEC